MRRRAQSWFMAALLAVGLVTIDAGASPLSAAAQALVTTTRYEPLLPCRLADQRRGIGFEQIDDKTAGIGLDACEIPADARAIVVTTTIVNARGNGWLLAYPSGRTPPTAATLNWSAGVTRANTAIVAVGTGHRIDVYRNDGWGGAPVIVDVVGAFVPAESSAHGRFVTPGDPQRLVDTRRDDGAPAPPGSVTRVPLPDGIPLDTTALAINITVVRTTREGYFSVYPAGSDRPDASTLNADAGGQYRAAATIVPVTADGFDVFTETGAHIVVDMTGWFTGDDADESSDGLFVPVVPGRLRDTRLENSPVHPGGAVEVLLPEGMRRAAAVAVSLTMVRPEQRGYVTVSPSRTQRSNTSSGYGMAGEVTAQFALSASSSAGVDVFSESGAEATVDLYGWFTGTPTATERATPTPNPVPVQRVIAIGDSSLAGIDRNRSWAQLRGAEFTLLARSCRRLTAESCRGREGPIPPPNALTTLRQAPVGYYDVAVIMTGYNDTMPQFASAVPTILDAARSVGIRRVVWLTQSREFRSDKGGPGAYQVYNQHNAVIRSYAAANIDMIAVEWSQLARQAPHWVYADGIHLDLPGGSAAADVISRSVAHVTGQSCPVPQFVGGPTVGVCPNPSTLPPVDVGALYGVF